MQESSTWEVNRSIVVRINLIDHVLELRLAWVLTQGSHDSAQLFARDDAFLGSMVSTSRTRHMCPSAFILPAVPNLVLES